MTVLGKDKLGGWRWAWKVGGEIWDMRLKRFADAEEPVDIGETSSCVLWLLITIEVLKHWVCPWLAISWTDWRIQSRHFSLCYMFLLSNFLCYNLSIKDCQSLPHSGTWAHFPFSLIQIMDWNNFGQPDLQTLRCRLGVLWFSVPLRQTRSVWIRISLEKRRLQPVGVYVTTWLWNKGRFLNCRSWW